MTIAPFSSMAPRTAGSKEYSLPPTLLRSSLNSNKPNTSSGISDSTAALGGSSSVASNSPSHGATTATSIENTLIVFDWDDTFFPTSALERSRLLRIPAQKMRPQLVQQLNYLAQMVVETLTLAEQYGKVVIITNSAPGWIDTSCQAFMPVMHAKIRSYPIFAKPMNYLLTYKLDVFKRELLQGRYQNLVSVGDGIAERTATLRLVGTQAAGTHRFCKSIKLKEMPTIQQLIDQLDLCQRRLEHLSKYQGDLDLRTNFGLTNARMGYARSQMAASSGCSFVHLSHLSPERNDEQILGPYQHNQNLHSIQYSSSGTPTSSFAGNRINTSTVSKNSASHLPSAHSSTSTSTTNHGSPNINNQHFLTSKPITTYTNNNLEVLSSNEYPGVGDHSMAQSESTGTLPRLIPSSMDILDSPEPQQTRSLSKPQSLVVGGIRGQRALTTSADKVLRGKPALPRGVQRGGAFTPPVGIGRR
ncbi:unnamed protein product [Amoebophrya sp. A120]|nr:unnamed protein product [Amoebophrya sp. A120]|eukprot:GSA120T00011298001.1